MNRNKALELIPLDEVAFHANERKEGPLIPSLKATFPYYSGGNANLISIGIEKCLEKDGTLHPDTIARTVLVVQMLQQKFGKQPIYRHYDVTGKYCPAPFVANNSLWEKFLVDVDKKEEIKVEQEKIVLTPGQQKAKDTLEKHGMMEADYEVKDNTILTLITMLAQLLNKLESKGSI